MVPKGYQYIGKYSKNEQTFLTSDNFGCITDVTVKNGNFIKTVRIGRTH